MDHITAMLFRGAQFQITGTTPEPDPLPNNLKMTGHNSSGQLGNNSTTHSSILVGVDSNIGGWSSISAGMHHTLAISEGKLYSWGSNTEGRTGLGSTIGNTLIPTQVGSETNWSRVSAGTTHCLGLRNGELWAWGWGINYQLGDGTTTTHSTPIRIGTDSNWVNVSAGYGTSYALNSNNQLYAWGININKRLGFVSNDDYVETPTLRPWTGWESVSAGSLFGAGIINGELWTWGYDENPQRVGTNSNWVQVQCGSDHMLALNSNNQLFTWGANDEGQLGDGTNNDSSTLVKIGGDNWLYIGTTLFNSSIASTTSNQIYVWGSNKDGALGLGDTDNRTSPVFLRTVGSLNWDTMSAGQDFIGIIT